MFNRSANTWHARAAPIGKVLTCMASTVWRTPYRAQNQAAFARTSNASMGNRTGLKQHLLESRFTLRSQMPELVSQELWGVLLAHNLIRYKMLLMAKSLPSVTSSS